MRGRIAVLSLLVIVLCFDTGIAAQSAPRVVEDYGRAEKLFAAGRYEEAIPLYEKVLAAHPSHLSSGDILIKIADSHFRLGNFKKALDAYRAAVRARSRSERVETQYWIGFCCFLLGRDNEAVAELLKIPALYPDSGMWVPTAYYWAARASERMGNKDQAAEYYRKAGGNRRSIQGRFALGRAEKIK